jgi:hypothetical protein
MSFIKVDNLVRFTLQIDLDLLWFTIKHNLIPIIGAVILIWFIVYHIRGEKK